MEDLHGLQFQNDLILHHKIGFPATYARTSILDLNRFLGVKSEAPIPKFDCESALIDDLSEEGAQGVIDCVTCADDLIREVFV